MVSPSLNTRATTVPIADKGPNHVFAAHAARDRAPRILDVDRLLLTLGTTP